MMLNQFGSAVPFYRLRWLTLSTQALLLTVDFMIYSHRLAAGAFFYFCYTA